ncbi:acetate--CoA ligase family protein [Streptomyces rubellomurinus]|uniref:acetate--CoA ligase family protein n=1 Tax=Streptomyces rubellomurinus (strain ATCC 31215) TaxID=359131 RepID=UPI00099C10F3
MPSARGARWRTSSTRRTDDRYGRSNRGPAGRSGHRSVRLAPLSERDLTAMVIELRSAPMLLGTGGAPPVDLATVRSVLARLSRLAEDFPEFVEADLNPVIVRPDGALCVDARVRLERRPDAPEPAATPRRSASRSLASRGCPASPTTSSGISTTAGSRPAADLTPTHGRSRSSGGRGRSR